MTYIANFVILISSLIKTIAIMQNILPMTYSPTYFTSNIKIMKPAKNPLRINVGYLIKESVGFIKDLEFEIPRLVLEMDKVAENLQGKVRINRTQRGILIDANFDASLDSECVRCLDDTQIELSTKFTELYSFDKSAEIDTELIIPEDRYIDLSPLVRDFLLVDLPINPLCKPDCAGLCPECGANHNLKECDCPTESIDPRFSSLSDLLEDEE